MFPVGRTPGICPFCKQKMDTYRLGLILPPMQAKVYDLIEKVPGISRSAIAERLGCSKQSVGVHVYHLRGNMQITDYAISNDRLGYRVVKRGSSKARVSTL